MSVRLIPPPTTAPEPKQDDGRGALEALRAAMAEDFAIFDEKMLLLVTMSRAVVDLHQDMLSTVVDVLKASKRANGRLVAAALDAECAARDPIGG